MKKELAIFIGFLPVVIFAQETGTEMVKGKNKDVVVCAESVTTNDGMTVGFRIELINPSLDNYLVLFKQDDYLYQFHVRLSDEKGMDVSPMLPLVPAHKRSHYKYGKKNKYDIVSPGASRVWFIPVSKQVRIGKTKESNENNLQPIPNGKYMAKIFVTVPYFTNGTYSVTASQIGTSATDTVQFKICKHGEWGSSTAVTFTLDNGFKTKINNAINKIPGVNVTLESVTGSVANQERVFCCNDGVEKKEIKNTKSFSLGAEIANEINIWGLPETTYTAGDSSLGFDFKLKAGLGLQPGNISFSVEQEKLTSQCDATSCITTSVGGSWTPSIVLGVEGEACIAVFGMSGCEEIAVTGALTATVGASLGYATADCTPNGWTGNATIGDGDLTLRTALGQVDWSKTWNVWEGASF